MSHVDSFTFARRRHSQVRRPSPNVGIARFIVRARTGRLGDHHGVITRARRAGTVENRENRDLAPIEFIVVDDGSTDGSSIICLMSGSAGFDMRRTSASLFEKCGGVHSHVAMFCSFSTAIGAVGAGVPGTVLMLRLPSKRSSGPMCGPCTIAATWDTALILSTRKKLFSVYCNLDGCRARQSITKISSLRAAGYSVPRNLFDALRSISQLRGWGGSEAAIALKAFFLGIDICTSAARWLGITLGPSFNTASPIWRSRGFTPSSLACAFDDSTWFEYWLPRVFEGCLSPETIDELDGAGGHDRA